MIKYALACDAGHGFEAWFRSSADYDGQAARGLLDCPVCGSAKVDKALMAPRVVTHKGGAAPVATDLGSDAPSSPAAGAGPVMAPSPPPAIAAATMPAGMDEFVAKLRDLKARLTENSENVGTRFPEEARRIHYGEAPPRQVHGIASPQEAEALVEEGVGILPLPTLPEERN